MLEHPAASRVVSAARSLTHPRAQERPEESTLRPNAPSKPRLIALARLSAIAALGVLLGVATATAEEATRVADLDWLAGHWRSDVDTVKPVTGQPVSEEWWTDPGGGLMLGSHRDMRPGRRSFFEYLRIEDREEGAVYFASPRGSEATAFPLVEHDNSDGQWSATFENPEHDWPQRLVYSRSGDRLTVKAEGLDETARQAEWQFSLVP